MAAMTESTVTVTGCKMHLRRAGSGQPVLFLHGAGGIPAWLPCFDQMSDSFDLLVPDHPSFGRSETPEWLDDMSDLAYFYLDFLKQLDLTDVHVVGQSLGGWLGLEMAVRSTDRIKSLTLVGSAGIRIKGAPAADIFMMAPEDLVRALYVDQSLADKVLSHEPSEEELDIQILNRVATARLGWQPRLFNPSLRKWLHRVDVPVHVVWGDQDKIIPPAYAGEFKKLLDGASVTMIEGTGHLPHVEKAGPFVEAVSGFIQRAA